MNDGSAHRVPGSPRAGRRPAPAARVSKRRFRTLNLVTTLPLFIAVGAVLIARQAQTWQDVLVLVLGLATVVVTFERWTAGDVGRVALPCLAVAAAVWPYGALTIDSPVQSAYYALSIVACLVVPGLPRHRIAAAVVVGVYVAGVGALSLVGQDVVDANGLLTRVILPTGLTAILLGLMFPNKRFYDVVAELEESRRREAELAVMGERIRFASELHDIQGHTLHVVKLKIALAQKLLRSDTDRVEQELREIYILVGDTITQTKELAYGQRRLNLSAELENARNLLEAAGMLVRVKRSARQDVPAIDLLAQVLRETTTNILRHSRATLVRIDLTERGVSIVNDGVAASVLPPLRGLATLSARVSDAGGELTVRLEDGHLLTAAIFPTATAPSVATDARPTTIEGAQP
jgi:two-component system sensor histidine kinase DesK